MKDPRTLTSIQSQEVDALADEQMRRMEWNRARRAGTAPTFPCRYCKEEFSPGRWWQLYCSDKCRANHFWDKKTMARMAELRSLKESLT